MIRQKANCLHIQTKYDLSKATTFLVVHDKTSFLHLMIVYVFYAYIPRVEIHTTAFKLYDNTLNIDHQQVQMDQISKKYLM